MTRGDVMSKTELLLSKLRNISVLVSIGAFAFFVIAFSIAIITNSVTFVNGINIDTGYSPILITLAVLFLVALIAARVIDIYLQKESKLMDVNEYRQSLKRNEEVSFSQTKIYSDIIRTKKSRYTEMASNEDKEEEVEENQTTNQSDLENRIKDTKLSFFARKKLEESMKQRAAVSEPQEIEEEVAEEEEFIEEVHNQTFMDKVKEVNWLFWKKENSQNELDSDEGKISLLDKVLEKIRNINWLFWKKDTLKELPEVFDEKQQDDSVTEEPDVLEDLVIEEKVVVVEEPIVEEKVVVVEEPTVEEKVVVVEEPTIEEKVVIEPEKVVVLPPKPKKAKIVTKTKADFIELIAASGEISKNKSNKFLGAFSKVIIEQLINGEEIELTGLGKMITIVMPAKEAVNPQTKQKIIVPEHRQVRMRFLEEFKDEFKQQK